MSIFRVSFLLWHLILPQLVAGEEVESAPGQCQNSEQGCLAENGSLGNDICGSWAPKTISVVLPCVNEAEFAIQTVKAVFKTVPSEVLQEIIVVDDGSSPPLAKSHISKAAREKYNVKLIRNEQTLGLIQAKLAGGKLATGDIIVFFDCHVAPLPGWHAIFLQRMANNCKRVVVPRITDLDIDTWKERGNPGATGGFSSCYVTWDVDFKWFDAPDEFVPILSGGLLGISRPWWNATSGYDEFMKGWGGENIDQSLRTWLCGGEIVAATDARVAHMWRTPDDPRTLQKYKAKPMDAMRNKVRAGVAWMGNFSKKLRDFGLLGDGDSGTWYGELGNILQVRERLGCKSFAWFLHRFRNVYVNSGLLPPEIFHLKHVPSNLCLTFRGRAGVSQSGRGTAELAKCDGKNARQRWHIANADPQNGDSCCSGLRAWNTDQCLATPQGGQLQTYVCEITGKKAWGQRWSLGEDNMLINGMGRGASCLTSSDGKTLQLGDCDAARSSGHTWEKKKPTVPLETKFYNNALKHHPEWGSST